LLVDDQPFFNKLHADMLRPRGYQVLIATNGPDGIQLAKAHLPDLVLLDVEMPGMDGIEVCRALKADDGTALIPVVMLTATRDPKLNERAFKAGASATVQKSIKVERILNIVQVVLQEKPRQRDSIIGM
jgi:two-component system cell cycle response regulator DivK